MDRPTESHREYIEEIAEQRRSIAERQPREGLVVSQETLYWFGPGELKNPSRLAPVLDLPVKTFELFFQEILPGAQSDLQRHMHETVHVVLEGHGYSVIGDKHFPWKTGDLIYTPPMVWHQHFNGDAQRSVRMLGIENSKLLGYLGLNFRESTET